MTKAATPVYFFSAIAAPDISPRAREVISDLAYPGTQEAAPGDFVAFEIKRTILHDGKPPSEVLVHLAGDDGNTVQRRFEELSPSMQEKLALGFAMLHADVRKTTIAVRAWQKAGKRLDRILITPNAGLCCSELGASNQHRFLLDRREEFATAPDAFLHQGHIMGFLPDKKRSAHHQLILLPEISDLASRVHANAFDQSTRKDRTWKHRRPIFEARTL